MNNVLLSSLAYYVTDKIPASNVDSKTYIGVDNMLPNCGGITVSDYEPCEGYVTKFMSGDILIGNIRPYFKKIWRATFEGGCSSDVLVIRSNGTVSSKYLYACLATQHFFDYVLAGSKGSKMPRGDKNHIMQYTVPLLDSEAEIGDFIDDINSKILLNESICLDLESLAKTIYDYWFLQFEFPNEDGKPYKSSGGKMIWNEELKREIPDGWETIYLKGQYELSRGVSYTSKDIKTGDGVPMINLACVDVKRNYKDGELKYYNGKNAEKAKVVSGDMLIACTDLTRDREIIGCPILVPNDGTEYVYSMDMAKLSFPSNKLNDLYMYMTLRTDSYHEYIKRWASGTNVLHLDLKGLDWYSISIPPIILQEKFAEIVQNVHLQKSSLTKENQELASLRDFLLPMLMNGQVTFKEVEE